MLVYHFAPKMKVRKGPMLLTPVVILFANSRGEAGKTYCTAEACGNDVVLAANRMPAYWRRLEGKQPECEDDTSEATLVAFPEARHFWKVWLVKFCLVGGVPSKFVRSECDKPGK